MPDGRALRIPHPEFLSLPPGSRIAAVHVGGVFRFVDLFLVSEIEFSRERRRRTA
jgi:hypothetical protein